MRGTGFIACWACEERVSAHAQPAVKWEQSLHVQSTIHAGHARNGFRCTLSMPGAGFIACWACTEPVSSHAERARKCLKVEYLSRIKYDFKKISGLQALGTVRFRLLRTGSKGRFHACVPSNSPNQLLWRKKLLLIFYRANFGFWGVFLLIRHLLKLFCSWNFLNFRMIWKLCFTIILSHLSNQLQQLF
jgi:hypothetical protein